MKSSKDPKPSWKVELPTVKDSFDKTDVNSLVLSNDGDFLYAGCGDNNVYCVNIEVGNICRTFAAHSDYVHNIFVKYALQ